MAAVGDLVEVAIEQLGARGDGIAQLGRTRVFVPLALPGERWRVRLTGRRADAFTAERLAPILSGARAAAPCPHFGQCGGCQLQHLPAADYAAWQREVVVRALARRGLGEVKVALPESAPAAARRRVRLAFSGRAGSLRLGFRVRSGNAVIAIEQCPVARPEIVALLPALRELLAALVIAAPGGEVQITAAASGLDLLLTTRLATGARRARDPGGFRGAPRPRPPRLAPRRPGPGRADRGAASGDRRVRRGRASSCRPARSCKPPPLPRTRSAMRSPQRSVP